MALPAVCFLILLLLSFVPSFHAACPDRMYCPAGADCSTDTALCQQSRCPAGGNINLLSNWTDDCEEGTTISFSRSSYGINEGSGPLQPVVILNNPMLCCTTSVTIRIDENTAKGGVDYGSKATSYIPVIISAGMTRASFDIPIINDRILEETETFTMSIDPVSLPYGVTLGSSASASVTIMDDDNVTVSFDKSTFSVNEQNRLAQLVLVLSNQASYNITVVVRTFDVTATGLCDYVPTLYSVIFPAGVTQVSFNINITDDELFEGPETFNVAILSGALPRSVNVGNHVRATVTIVDNEKSITVNFNQSTFTVKEYEGPVTPVLTLSKPSSCCLTIRATLKNVTATGRGIDYGYTTPQVYTFTFPAGATCASSDISIPITDDMISENDETFNIVIIEISLPFGVKLGSVNKATVRILDNDNAVRFDKPMYRVFENRGPVMVALVLDKPAQSNIVVQVDDIGITAVGNTDYTSGPYYPMIRKGTRRVPFSVRITNDNRAELDETFNLTINSTSLPFGIVRDDPYSTTVTIVDDEYTVCFSKSHYDVREGRSVQIDVVANKRVQNTIAVRMSYDNSLTASSSDYSTPPRDVRIYTGRDVASFFIYARDDRILEYDETFVIVASPPLTPDDGNNCNATVTILDNDAATVRFESSQYLVRNKNDPERPVLLLSTQASFPISVRIFEDDRTATGDEDYEIQNYNPVFYPGETKHTLLLDLVDDDIVEDNEFYFLNISESLPQHVTVGRYPSTKIIIQDDDISYLRVTGTTLDLSKPLFTKINIRVNYRSGSYRDITVTAGQTRVPVGATRIEISMIQVCVPKSIASDTRAGDSLVKMRCF